MQHFLFKKKQIFSSSMSLLYAFIFGSNVNKGAACLPSMYLIEYLKRFLQKETLLDSTILLISKF